MLILFLNKSDLFAQKVQKHHLKDYFPDYDGADRSYEDGIRFIQNKFAEQRSDKAKIIYTHVSCATDPKNVQVLFDAVRDIIVRRQFL